MSTIRINGIPLTTTKKDLCKASGVQGDNISLATTSASVSTATITFPTPRAANRFLNSKKPSKCLGRRPSMDSTFKGLTILSSSAHDEVDLVAIHGLNGHAFSTWAAGDRMWLRDFLPEQLPKTRIMTYGYNSNIFDSASTTTIPEFAQGLLGALTNARSGPKERKRPIVFVCHSLGGIVVKLALNLARQQESTATISTAAAGIIFLATPHRGSSTASSSVLGLTSKALGGRTELFQALRVDSGQLASIEHEFRLHHGSLQLATFYETKKTKIARVVSAFDHMIVSRSSTLYDGARFPLERTHSEICKFANRHEEDYRAVENQVVRMVAAARPAVVKALHMPQIAALFKLGAAAGGGAEAFRGYSEAWTDDCTLRLR